MFISRYNLLKMNGAVKKTQTEPDEPITKSCLECGLPLKPLVLGEGRVIKCECNKIFKGE